MNDVKLIAQSIPFNNWICLNCSKNFEQDDLYILIDTPKDSYEICIKCFTKAVSQANSLRK